MMKLKNRLVVIGILISFIFLIVDSSFARVLREDNYLDENEIENSFSEYLSIKGTQDLVELLDDNVVKSWRNREVVLFISEFLGKLKEWQMNQEIEVNTNLLTKLKGRFFQLLLSVKKQLPSKYEINWVFGKGVKQEIYEQSAIKFIGNILNEVSGNKSFLNILRYNLEQGIGGKIEEITTYGALEISYKVVEKSYFRKMVYDPWSGEWEPQGPFAYDYDKPICITVTKALKSGNYKNAGRIEIAVPVFPTE